jgi:hypothetical protein
VQAYFEIDCLQNKNKNKTTYFALGPAKKREITTIGIHTTRRKNQTRTHENRNERKRNKNKHKLETA